MATAKADGLVEWNVEEGIATITLNRPERLNALSRDMLLALRQALDEGLADKAARVVLITGAGRAFCTGQDLAERDPRKLDRALDLEAVQRELYHPVVEAMTLSDKPVIVAVNGAAAGAGAGIALGGDIVLAARSARFILSFVKIGLSMDAGLGWHLVRTIGPARTRALAVLGGEIGAAEAERSGLIWKCVDDDALQGAARDLAAGLAAGPRVALASIKRTVAAACEAGDFSSYLKTEAAHQREAGHSSDYGEGVLAFLEKRKPHFGG